jgi:protein-S-isoprenylcysteine O-methyltransferase Ste14
MAWLNLGMLALSTILTLHFYVKSAGPVALERRIGPSAFARCTRYRFVAAASMTMASINYVVYRFYPLPIALPARFPWPWWVSAVIAGAIALPAGYLFFRGVRDAGQETMFTRKDHTLYGGIYRHIRHPQAAGELPFWWVLAFLLHSPFLALYSLIWIPVFAIMVWAEERDLVLRYGQAYEEYRARTGALFPRRHRRA